MHLRRRLELAPGPDGAGARASADTRICAPGTAPGESDAQLVCPWCRQEHRLLRLRTGERATCVRCGAVLATRSSGLSSSLAYATTGLLLAPPALLLPFVIVDKFGAQRVTWVLTAVEEIWHQGMHWLGVWVLLCGSVAPVVVLTLLALLWMRQRQTVGRRRPIGLSRLASAVSKWAMPEVQILAVLVAFTKLGTVVDVRLGAGFWCYAAMSLSFLLAWRSFELDPAGVPPEAASEGGDG